MLNGDEDSVEMEIGVDLLSNERPAPLRPFPQSSNQDLRATTGAMQVGLLLAEAQKSAENIGNIYNKRFLKIVIYTERLGLILFNPSEAIR